MIMLFDPSTGAHPGGVAYTPWLNQKIDFQADIYIIYILNRCYDMSIERNNPTS